MVELRNCEVDDVKVTVYLAVMLGVVFRSIERQLSHGGDEKVSVRQNM